jgi:hypothetical protein
MSNFADEFSQYAPIVSESLKIAKEVKPVINGISSKFNNDNQRKQAEKQLVENSVNGANMRRTKTENGINPILQKRTGKRVLANEDGHKQKALRSNIIQYRNISFEFARSSPPSKEARLPV